MSLDTKVKNLIINTNMTKEQYEAIDDKSNQLFFVEDSSVVDVPAPEENQSGYLHTDGANLTWEEIESGDKLPDQTDNAGKFLTTDGTTASWGEALVNNSTKSNTIMIAPDNPYDYGGSDVSIGYGSTSGRGRSVHIGYNSYDSTTTGFSVGVGADSKTSSYTVAIGYQANASTSGTVAIGSGAMTTASGAILISAASDYKIRAAQNNDANTFKVATQNGNFEMMDANGNIPLDRLTYVTDQIGDISTVLDSINGETLEG